MPSDLVVTVRQISNYPTLNASNGTENILVQQGGLGGPYATLTTSQLVATALQIPQRGPMGVGIVPPAGADGDQIFVGNHILPTTGGLFFNAYITQPENTLATLASGPAGLFGLQGQSFAWDIGSGLTGQAPTIAQVMSLSMAGNLTLPFGTLTVARDPATYFEVATMGWVGNNTVASFNKRIGNVTLNAADVYGALQLCDPIATQPWVIQAIQAGIQNLLTTCRFVNTWNGRSGSVYLTLSDITTVFFQPGQQPVTPTPPLTSNDYSIANTAWVVEYIANEFAGSGGNLATQSWVLANTVNSFNGRMGPVGLTLADVTNAGGAPLNSPNFSGIPQAPTANPGQATGQIATTAFVQQAISHNTAGVSTFNTRSGDVVLTSTDISAAGGLANPSPNLTGSPTAPTAAPGTSTPQIANTQFVMTALGNAVTSFNTRTGAVTLTLLDITGAGGAPLVSPNFSSVPTAPTAAPGTSTVQLATTAFVTNAVTSAGGVSSFNSRTGAVTLEANDISAAGGLANPSVALTGTPTAPTATAGTNSQQIATTGFVVAALASGAVTSFNTRTGAITLTGADITAAGGAVLASPAFTGAPTAPTAVTGTNNTQIATTQFVNAEIAANTNTVTSFNTRTGAITLIAADITAAGGAVLASPAFTGVPTGPTATAGTSTTQLATTQFVQAAIAGSGVSSFNSRTGAVTLVANDVSAAGGALIASPTFTGTPAAPTAAPATATTQIATTAFVMAAIAQPGTATPLMNAATAAVGSSLLYSRQDHVHPSDTSRLALTGGTLTGPLNGTSAGFSAGVNGNTFQISGPVNQIHQLFSQSGGSTRWALQLGDGSTESGSNLGANFVLSGWSDANVFIQNWLTITRANGSATFNGGNVVSATSGNPQFLLANAAGGGLGAVFYASGIGVAMRQLATNGQCAVDGGGNFVITGVPFAPTAGPWNAVSDARIKTKVGSYDAGLAAILRVNPVVFTYKGNNTPTAATGDALDASHDSDTAPYPASMHYRMAVDGTEVVGLIAQEVEDVLPGMVTRGPGFIDGVAVTDLRTLNAGELTYALVNAVKELAARLTALEGATA